MQKKKPGHAGLYNIGNTCYMNSSLQCLAHTVPFIIHYLSGKYREEINESNPLGCGGKLARAFGDLMMELWQVSPSTSTFQER
jgi:ubiquitin C-terminal hydrolase